MARKAAWPPPVHRHPSGQARVRVRGKDYYLGAYGSEAARAAYAALLARLGGGDPGPAPAGREATVRAAAEAWLAEEMPRYAGKKEAWHFRRVLGLLVRHFGRLPAGRFRAGRLGELRSKMLEEGWCRKHVNRNIVRVRTVWRWLEMRELAPPGSWANLRTLAGLPPGDPRARETAKRKGAALAAVDAVCARVRPQVAAMIRLQWLTGMRPDEVCRMRACEVDRTGDVWVYRPATHKNAWRGQSRQVPLGPACQEVLRPWLARARPQDYLFRPSSRTRARKKDHYTVDVYGQNVRRAAKAAGVKLTPYDLRHACAERVAGEMGLDYARSVLGQRSLEVAYHYASGADGRLAAEAARRLG